MKSEVPKLANHHHQHKAIIPIRYNLNSFYPKFMYTLKSQGLILMDNNLRIQIYANYESWEMRLKGRLYVIGKFFLGDS